MNKTVDKYILQRGPSSFLVRLPRSVLRERTLGTFETLEAAQAARDQELARAAANANDPVIEGLTNEYQGRPIEDLWADAYAAQDLAQQHETRRANQCVTVPDASQAFGIAWLSDSHFGSAETDYRALRQDAETIRDTPRLYAEFHGDGCDNWINAKLADLQRDQAMPFDNEVRLFASWLDMLRGKWIAVIAGNHDNWTRKLAGIDQLRQSLDGMRVLYDSDEVCFTLMHGPNEWRVKLRHKWKYGSVTNATHPIEVGWQRVAVGQRGEVQVFLAARNTNLAARHMALAESGLGKGRFDRS